MHTIITQMKAPIHVAARKIANITRDSSQNRMKLLDPSLKIIKKAGKYTLTISQGNWTFVIFVGNNTMWVLAFLGF